MSIILHGMERSPPFRAALITAKALGIKWKIQIWDMDKMEHMSEEFLKINPAHTIPAMEDDGFYIWESHSIMCYLVSKYGKNDRLYPKDLKQRATVDTILHFNNGYLWHSIILYIGPQIFNGQPANLQLKEDVNEKLSILERILSDRTYLAGDHLTIADISVLTAMSFLSVIRISIDPFPKIKAWIAKAKSDLPFYDEINKCGQDDMTVYIESQLKSFNLLK